MWQAGLVLFWDTKKDVRFFLEMKEGGGFSFKVHEAWEIKECQERVNKIFKDDKKNLCIKIKKNESEKNIFDVECFSLDFK